MGFCHFCERIHRKNGAIESLILSDCCSSSERIRSPQMHSMSSSALVVYGRLMAATSSSRYRVSWKRWQGRPFAFCYTIARPSQNLESMINRSYTLLLLLLLRYYSPSPRNPTGTDVLEKSSNKYEWTHHLKNSYFHDLLLYCTGNCQKCCALTTVQTKCAHAWCPIHVLNCSWRGIVLSRKRNNQQWYVQDKLIH